MRIGFEICETLNYSYKNVIAIDREINSFANQKLSKLPIIKEDYSAIFF